MKEFACGDVVPGCGTRYRAASEEQVVVLARAHGRDAHGMTEEQMDDELMRTVRMAIHDVA